MAFSKKWFALLGMGWLRVSQSKYFSFLYKLSTSFILNYYVLVQNLNFILFVVVYNTYWIYKLELE